MMAHRIVLMVGLVSIVLSLILVFTGYDHNATETSRFGMILVAIAWCTWPQQPQS